MEDKHPVICDTFMEIVPEPIDILGPFLSLVTGCEELDSIEDMCGALSSMSMSVDFRRMFKVPMEIRQAVKFSLRVREEYRIQWDRFFMETPEFEVVQFARGIVLSGVYSDNDKVTTVDEGEDVNEYSGATIVDDGEEFDEEAYRAKFLADISGSKEVVKDAEEVAQASTQPSAFDLLRGIK
jgi:hypothetical protein